MEILPGALVTGLTLFLEKEKILVIGDVHIGYEEALNKQGVLIPRFHLSEIMAQLDTVFKEVQPEAIVLLGDLKHEFGTISNQEWRDTIKFIDYLSKHCKKIILLKGNHDKIMAPLARRAGFEMRDFFTVGPFFLCHGDRTFDKLPEFKKAKAIIIGHEHPAVSIRDGARVEKYKCFLVGKYSGKKLIVAPSINPLTEGTDVLQEKTLSPFIKNIDSFKAVLLSDKAYDFGSIKKLRQLLSSRQ